MGKSTINKTTRIRFGRRTFFFDVYISSSNKKFLRITQSEFLGEGKDRQYNSFILFPDDIAGFQKSMGEVTSALG